jgi:hypothetical protein
MHRLFYNTVMLGGLAICKLQVSLSNFNVLNAIYNN